MNKDIYIIKNSVNNKVYIGQSKDPPRRWLHHIYDARYEEKQGKFNQEIHRAMIEIGIDKFHYEILEHLVPNPDEREAYWIKKYKSTMPNGYNLSPGSNGYGDTIDNSMAIFRDHDTLLQCITEISSSNKTFENIARKFGCCIEVIHAINNGERYKINELSYPLRNTRYTTDLVKQIKYSLKYEEDLTLRDIADKYNIDYSQVSCINTGKIYFVNTDNYPLRKKRKQDLSMETADKIINDIASSQLSFKEIAKKYNVSAGTITAINIGRQHNRDGLEYPIRSNKDPRNKSKNNFLDIEEVREILELLKTNISVRNIAEIYNVSASTIRNINNGTNKKYRLQNYTYPIRKLK